VRVLSHGEGARPGVERMRSATNHSGRLGHRKSQGPDQGGGEGGREFSLPGSLPCLPALSRADPGQGGSSLRVRMPRKPPFSGRDDTTARLPPSPLTVLSITVRHWRLRNGSESCVPPTCSSNSSAESRRRDGLSTGQGAALPADLTTALDRHPAPEPGRSGMRHPVRH
jgi:hypothetical protein